MTKKLIYLSFVAALLVAQTGPMTFSSPQEARDALIQAAATSSDAVLKIFGPGAAEIVRTGDSVQDKNVVARFNTLAAEKAEIETDPMNPDRASLVIGLIEWPFAVPIVRKNGRWYFDVQEGKAEIRRRTIGGNELDAIDICRGYVEAQKLYAERDWSGTNLPQYARKIISSEGKKDGLYWPGDDSPVAAGFAKAVAEGYSRTTDTRTPYHGYFFKVLLKQGAAAPGGAQDYIIGGAMIGGFALVAWPAAYGVSGIKTFIVNHDGIVYEKDLGSQTGALGKAMTAFNPDQSWDVSPEVTWPET